MTTALALTLTELQHRGFLLGQTLPSGAVVWLKGPLGAGKTTLVQAILAGRGVLDEVSSPTYAMVHHYGGPRGDCYHLDCYRMRSEDDATDLDWETISRGDLLLIEWPEKAGAWAPVPTQQIDLEYVDDEHRTLVIA